MFLNTTVIRILTSRSSASSSSSSHRWYFLVGWSDITGSFYSLYAALEVTTCLYISDILV